MCPSPSFNNDQYLANLALSIYPAPAPAFFWGGFLKQVQDFSISCHLLILKMFFTAPFADLCSQVDERQTDKKV